LLHGRSSYSIPAVVGHSQVPSLFPGRMGRFTPSTVTHNPNCSNGFCTVSTWPAIDKILTGVPTDEVFQVADTMNAPGTRNLSNMMGCVPVGHDGNNCKTSSMVFTIMKCNACIPAICSRPPPPTSGQPFGLIVREYAREPVQVRSQGHLWRRRESLMLVLLVCRGELCICLTPHTPRKNERCLCVSSHLSLFISHLLYVDTVP